MPKVASTPGAGSAPAAAAGAASSHPANEGAKPLSTDSLIAGLKAEFVTEPPAAVPITNLAPAGTPAPAPGQEPSPAAPLDLPVEGSPSVSPAPAAPALPEGSAPAAAEPEDIEEGKWPEKAIDTVTSLRAQRRELKTELRSEFDARQKLEAELAALKSAPTAPTKTALSEADPATANATPEVQKLLAAEATQNRTVEFCGAMLRRLGRDPEGVLVELGKANVALTDTTPEAVTEFLENAREAARQKALTLATERTVLAAEARRSSQSDRAQTEAKVRELAPELKDPKHPRSLLYAQTLEAFPNMRTSPQGPLIALVHTLGMERLKELGGTAHGAANGNGNGTHANGATKPAPPPPRGARPANAPRIPANTQVSGNSLFKAYQEKPTKENREAWMKTVLAET